MPELSEQSARQCYDLARAFYKGGIKAENKMYLGAINQDKADSRYQKIMEGRTTLPHLRGRGIPAMTAGRHLRNTGNTRGNCWEMSSVAASFVAELIPNAPVHIVGLQPPGDHGFVVVGNLPPGLQTIEELTLASPDDVTYVLDVWSGIFCHIKRYHSEFMRKMIAWEGQGKRIVEGERPVEPSGVFAPRTVGARMIVMNPYSSASGSTT